MFLGTKQLFFDTNNVFFGTKKLSRRGGEGAGRTWTNSLKSEIAVEKTNKSMTKVKI